MLTVAEVASQLRISRPTAYRLARSGAIPTVRIGGSLRVPARQLVDTLARSQLRMRKRIGELVGQRDLTVTANTYTHVMVAEGEVDYANLLA